MKPLIFLTMSPLSEEILEKYIEAGKIAKSALKYAVEYVSPKRKINLFELCEAIEGYIRSKGASLAFPCNLSFNEVAAHYSPTEPDDELVFDNGLLKIDVGAMVDGYIADTAVTIARGYEYEKLAVINKQILNEVLAMFKPGVSLGSIGKYVENRAKKSGYKPISNLSGHLVGNYTLHGGKSVPNVGQFFSPKIEAWEVYAVEPFLTFGDASGEVMNSSIVQIYSLTKMKKIKDKSLNQVKDIIYKKFRFLPFSPRWLVDEFGEDAYSLVGHLFKMRYLRGYPALIERTRRFVSQFEHTIIVTDGEPIIITS